MFVSALRHSTNGGDWKEAASRLASSLVNVRLVLTRIKCEMEKQSHDRLLALEER